MGEKVTLVPAADARGVAQRVAGRELLAGGAAGHLVLREGNGKIA